MLGKYSVGESRGFLRHEGHLGQNGTKVVVVECPPIREEDWQDYYTNMEATVDQLASTVHSVLVLVKYSPIGFGGFRLDREKNIPEEELFVLRNILGDGLKNNVSIVVTNWSRQFARISERRLRGITEDQVEKKLQEEMAYSIGCHNCSVYFMDTVFWRTEQKAANVPNTLPTTLETLQILLVKILDEISLERTAVTSLGQPPDLLQTSHLEQLPEGSSSTSEDEVRPSQNLSKSKWKNKIYQNLAEDSQTFQQRMSSSSECSSMVEADESIPIPIKIVPPSEKMGFTYTPTRESRVELSDYIEAKVRQMMDKEGVILDFSDSKLRGKIVTTTKIIKEVTTHDGNKKIIEDEEIAEEHFGSELESVSSQSLDQYEYHPEMETNADPIFIVGAPVLSTTFDRRRIENPVSNYDENGEEQKEHIWRTRKASDTSESSSSISDCETIEVVHEVLEENGTDIDLASLQASIVILGQEPNLSHMKSFLEEHNVNSIFTCEVQASKSGISIYDGLTRALPSTANIIFIWTVETKTGEISDDLVWMFSDFIEAFSDKAIENMIVVLWHPSKHKDLNGSLPDLSKIVQNNFEYKSSLGFAVLQYRPVKQFYRCLSKKIAEAKMFHWIKPCMPEKTAESTEVFRKNSGEQKDTIISTVDDPVVVLVSPPGHGKSSIGNMLLGPGHFQVRGAAFSDSMALQAASGLLSDSDIRITCIEAPGIFEDGIDQAKVVELDRHLRSIGFITHILVVWDALEWRLEDLDFVLSSLRKIFGIHIGLHIVFAVTFWDLDKKGRKERKKKKITHESVSKMIRDRMEATFGLPDEPLMYFISAKSPRDPSCQYLKTFLASKNWAPFTVDQMKDWLQQLGFPCSTQTAFNTDTDGHDYEDVGRYNIETETSSTKNLSKSLHNIVLNESLGKNTDHIQREKAGDSKVNRVTSSPKKGQSQVTQKGRPRPNFFGSRSPHRSSLNNKHRSQSHGSLFGQDNIKRPPSIVSQKSAENIIEHYDSPHILLDNHDPSKNTYRQNSVNVDTDIDAIEKDPEFQPSQEKMAAKSRVQGRQRLTSGSSGSLSLSGFGKARSKPRQQVEHKSTWSNPRSRSRSKSSSESESAPENIADTVGKDGNGASWKRRGQLDVDRNESLSSTVIQKGRSTTSLNGKGSVKKSPNHKNLGSIGGSRQTKSRSQTRIDMGTLGGSRQSRPRTLSMASLGGSRPARQMSETRTSLTNIGGSRQSRPGSQSRTSFSSLGGSRPSRQSSGSRISLSNIGGSRGAKPRSQSQSSLSIIGGKGYGQQHRSRSQSRTSTGSFMGMGSKQGRTRSQSRTKLGSSGGSEEKRGPPSNKPDVERGQATARLQNRGRSGSRPARGQAEACSIM